MSEVPPEGLKDANVRSHLKLIAERVDDMLPENWGFVIICQPFGEAEGRCNYISNIQREDAIDMVSDWLLKVLSTKTDFGKHI